MCIYSGPYPTYDKFQALCRQACMDMGAGTYCTDYTVTSETDYNYKDSTESQNMDRRNWECKLYGPRAILESFQDSNTTSPPRTTDFLKMDNNKIPYNLLRHFEYYGESVFQKKTEVFPEKVESFGQCVPNFDAPYLNCMANNDCQTCAKYEDQQDCMMSGHCLWVPIAKLPDARCDSARRAMDAKETSSKDKRYMTVSFPDEFERLAQRRCLNKDGREPDHLLISDREIDHFIKTDFQYCDFLNCRHHVQLIYNFSILRMHYSKRIFVVFLINWAC